MVEFVRQTVNVITAAQPWNLYAGTAPLGMTEVQDNEQYWMRDQGMRICEKLNSMGHDAHLAPMADHFSKNVEWCNANRADWIFSCHSNATAFIGDVPKGVGVYTNLKYTAPATSILANAIANSMRDFPGGSYVRKLSVSELAKTFDRSLLTEFNFHDSAEMAAWVRDARNREAMANKFCEGFAAIYGQKNAPMTTITTPLHQSVPTPVHFPAFPLGRVSGQQAYFGPRTGPIWSVSGYYNHRTELRVWQAQAARRGRYLGVADGLYGPVTRNAAVITQRANGLTEDGLIGRQTWNANWIGR